jgi:hypothetical protein
MCLELVDIQVLIELLDIHELVDIVVLVDIHEQFDHQVEIVECLDIAVSVEKYELADILDIQE